MKSRLIVSAFLFLSFAELHSQSDSLPNKHKHELGADVTGLLKQFFFNNYNAPTYFPAYYISYRYHLKKTNIRFGLGAQYSNRQSSPYLINGEEKTFSNISSSFSFRIGYEKFSELSNKWQAFYGVDFRSSTSSVNNQAHFSNAYYINGSISATQVYGIAPLLGFRYRISKRVSILTETSFSFNLEKTWSQKTSISMDELNYPPLNAAKKIKATNYSANFIQPVFLILAVDI